MTVGGGGEKSPVPVMKPDINRIGKSGEFNYLSQITGGSKFYRFFSFLLKMPKIGYEG